MTPPPPALATGARVTLGAGDGRAVGAGEGRGDSEGA
jgi:hypothetical protein